MLMTIAVWPSWCVYNFYILTGPVSFAPFTYATQVKFRELDKEWDKEITYFLVPISLLYVIDFRFSPSRIVRVSWVRNHNRFGREEKTLRSSSHFFVWRFIIFVRVIRITTGFDNSFMSQANEINQIIVLLCKSSQILSQARDCCAIFLILNAVKPQSHRFRFVFCAGSSPIMISK